MRALAVIVLPLALVAASCGSAPEPGETNLKSKAGLFRGHFTPDPNPAETGYNALELALSDSSGKAVTGATLGAEPTMPSHGHGSPITPKVEDQGQGRYRISDLVYSMPGKWQVRVQVEFGNDSDEFAVDLEVH